MHKVIGIDISKDTFDVSFLEADGTHRWQKFDNAKNGFKALCKQLTVGDHCVMEASGPYYLHLAYHLHAQGLTVSVINPLVIRRFCQMRLTRAKTDKKDALMIARYAQSEPTERWQPVSQTLTSLGQLETAIEGLIKCVTMLSNQMEAFTQHPDADATVLAGLRKQISGMQKQLSRFEAEQKQLIKAHYSESYRRLLSIPGIGPKTAAALIVITGNFERFDSAKKLIAYAGLSPRLFQSGTSVKGKARICKMGQGHIRKLLYICSLSAKNANVYCRQLYERLRAKGKHDRVIKIAIAAKLMRQAFAIVTKEKSFEKNLSPMLGF